MSQIHAGHDAPQISEGRCTWRFGWEDVWLRCEDRAIPGLTWCADHFIDWAHARADAGIPPATPTAVKAEAAARGKAS